VVVVESVGPTFSNAKEGLRKRRQEKERGEDELSEGGSQETEKGE